MALTGDPLEASSDVIDITGKPEVRISRQDLPPSPPLTRSNSTSSINHDGQVAAEEKNTETEWDPLQHEEEEEFTAAQGQMYEAGDSVVDVNGRVIYPKSKRSHSNLQLEVEHRLTEPQPWDLVDPPSTNGEKPPNSYGTLTSHKFSTFQDSAYVSPLLFGSAI